MRTTCASLYLCILQLFRVAYVVRLTFGTHLAPFIATTVCCPLRCSWFAVYTHHRGSSRASYRFDADRWTYTFNLVLFGTGSPWFPVPITAAVPHMCHATLFPPTTLPTPTPPTCGSPALRHPRYAGTLRLPTRHAAQAMYRQRTVIPPQPPDAFVEHDACG